jgi:hypothetical protein
MHPARLMATEPAHDPQARSTNWRLARDEKEFLPLRARVSVDVWAICDSFSRSFAQAENWKEFHNLQGYCVPVKLA